MQMHMATECAYENRVIDILIQTFHRLGNICSYQATCYCGSIGHLYFSSVVLCRRVHSWHSRSEIWEMSHRLQPFLPPKPEMSPLNSLVYTFNDIPHAGFPHHLCPMYNFWLFFCLTKLHEDVWSCSQFFLLVKSPPRYRLCLS